MSRPAISREALRTAVVLLLVVSVSALFIAMCWPFLKPLLVGAIFAGLFRPLYRWLTRFCRGRSLGAVLTLVILFIVIAGSFSAFVGVVVRQAVKVSEQAIPWAKEHFGAAGDFNAHDWLVQHYPVLTEYIPSEEQILQSVGDVAQATGAFLVAAASRVTAGTAAFLLDFFVMIYAMFFFLRDGPKILERIFYYLPLKHEDEERMLEQFRSITRATVKGTLVIGVLQGFLAGVAFWIAGIDGAAFWGTVMTVLSIVPGIGAPLVWIPAVIYLYTTHHALAATLLMVWCGGVVGSVDNLLRPILVGKDAKMPDLLILIGTLGGIFLFGPIGFIIGPIVCGLFLTAWDIYGNTFREILPAVQSLGTPGIDPPVTPRPEHPETRYSSEVP